jgi:hypothetical protein
MPNHAEADSLKQQWQYTKVFEFVVVRRDAGGVNYLQVNERGKACNR